MAVDGDGFRAFLGMCTRVSEALMTWCNPRPRGNAPLGALPGKLFGARAGGDAVGIIKCAYFRPPQSGKACISRTKTSPGILQAMSVCSIGRHTCSAQLAQSGKKHFDFLESVP